MYCHKCGTQLPDDAAFCVKCGTKTNLTVSNQPNQSGAPSKVTTVVAPSGVTSLKCPSCGAPLSPKFGEMIISCEYCGSGVTLGLEGWKGIQKTSMLPLRYGDKDQMTRMVGEWMNHGLFNGHRQEKSTLEEFTLNLVPYWIVTASAKTSVTRADMMGGVPPPVIIFGPGPFGGPPHHGPPGGSPHGPHRGVGFVTPLLANVVAARMMGGPPGAAREAKELNNNYYFPVIALKAWGQYQPRNYQFNLDSREHFDVNKVPKDMRVLNGDIGEDAATAQAKTLISQLQADKVNMEYRSVEKLETTVDVSELELLYVPIWYVRYDHKGKKIILVVDAFSGKMINSAGL